jgi:hypothetical protein
MFQGSNSRRTRRDNALTTLAVIVAIWAFVSIDAGTALGQATGTATGGSSDRNADGLKSERSFGTQQLTSGAELILRGKVSSLRPSWVDGKSRIVTYVTLSVDEYLKGSAGGTLTVSQPGGEIDGVGELYTHMPRFTSDEEVVVFAKREKSGTYRVYGGDQGKISVVKDARTGSKMVSLTRTLDDFATEVKSIVDKQTDK